MRYVSRKLWRTVDKKTKSKVKVTQIYFYFVVKDNNVADNGNKPPPAKKQ